jgi:hypothetical protein
MRKGLQCQRKKYIKDKKLKDSNKSNNQRFKKSKNLKIKELLLESHRGLMEEKEEGKNIYFLKR